MGTNAVGKTSLARSIHGIFSYDENEEEEFISFKNEDDRNCTVTLMNDTTCHLGKLTRKGACSGSDTLSSVSAYKDSLNRAFQHRDIVVVDGIMATGQWINWMSETGANVVLIHLDCSEEENLVRLKHRRAEKKGLNWRDVEITEKTSSNVAGKRRSFRNIYRKVGKDERLNSCLYIDTTGKNRKQVFDQFLFFLDKFSKGHSVKFKMDDNYLEE